MKMKKVEGRRRGGEVVNTTHTLFLSMFLLILAGFFWNIDKWASTIMLLAVVLINTPIEDG